MQAAHPVLHQRRHWMCAGEINPGRRIDVPACRETYVEHKLSTSLFPSVKGYCSGNELGFLHVRRHLVVRSLGVFFWSCWPPETFGTSAGWTSSSFLGLPTCTLRNWNPRLACGTAFSSVHNISSVFGFVPTWDEPAECLPWTR